MPTPGEELGSIPFESVLGGPLIACVNAQAAAAMSTVNFIKEVGFKQIADEQDPTQSETGDPIYVTFKYPKELASFQPAVPGTITSLALTAGGTGYVAGPVNITGGGGAGATAAATVNAAGVVTALTVVNPGSGYTNGSVNITGGSGSGAQATATVADVQAVPAQIQEMKLEVPILTMLPIPYLRIEDVTIDFNAKIDSIEYKKIDTSLKIDASLELKRGSKKGSVQLNVSVAYQRNTQQGASVQRTYSMGVHIKAVQDEIPAGMQKVLDILEKNMRSEPASAPSRVLIP